MTFDPRILTIAKDAGQERIFAFGVAYLASLGMDAPAISLVAEIDQEQVEMIFPAILETIKSAPGKSGKNTKVSSEKALRAKCRSAIAEDAKPTEKDSAAAKDAGMSGRVAWQEWSKFVNHHRAKGSLMADWSAAWRTWCANWRRFAEERGEIAPRSVAAADDDRPNGRSPDHWRQAMQAFVERRFWPSANGPEPWTPGCFVPADILAEFRRAA